MVSTDPHVQLVSTIQNVIKTSNSNIEVNQPQPKHLKTILIKKKKVEKKFEEEVKQQRWIGQYTVQQWQDEHLHHESYNIAMV